MNEYVVYRSDGRWAYGFSETLQEAEFLLGKANAERAERLSNLPDRIEWAKAHEYDHAADLYQAEMKDLQNVTYRIGSWDDLNAAHDEYLSNLSRIAYTTESRYYEMLDVLPPIQWHTAANGVKSFCMSEFFSGSWTDQYAYDPATGKYYTKLVNIRDCSTWIENDPQITKDRNAA